MGKRGRAPLPKAIHEQRGTYRNDRHGGGMEVPVGIPDPPPHFEGRTLDLWNSLTGQLKSANVITNLDETALQLLCESVDIYVMAQEDIERHGIVVQGARSPIANPAVSIRDKAWHQIMNVCKQFGMTPSSRNGIKAGPKEDSKRDNAADVIGFKVIQ